MWLSSSNAGGNLPFPLSEGSFLIGRSSECQIVVLERTVSRVHARITCLKNQAWIEDLGSRNGTLVQGRKITRSELKAAADLHLGNASLHLSEQRFLADRSLAISAEVTQINLLPPGALRDPARSFTRKQHEVFVLLLQRIPPKDIASQLDKSVNTVYSQVRIIYAAFGVHSQLALLAKFN